MHCHSQIVCVHVVPPKSIHFKEIFDWAYKYRCRDNFHKHAVVQSAGSHFFGLLISTILLSDVYYHCAVENVRYFKSQG